MTLELRFLLEQITEEEYRAEISRDPEFGRFTLPEESWSEFKACIFLTFARGYAKMLAGNAIPVKVVSANG